PATGGSFLLAAGVSSARRRTGMQGSLGEKIGEGAFSEAYAWAPGQVVKLFKAGVSHLLGRHEVRMIRAVRAAGVPVPEVFGNVIMTAEGPRLVDWTFAMRAPAAVDLGFLHVILSELAPEIADNPERPRATNAAAQSEYAQLAGMSLAELTAAMKPYLPIVRT